MTDDQSKDKTTLLTDEEIASLLDPGLDPGERARLVALLEQDQESVRILAFAAGLEVSDEDGLSAKSVERLLDTVRGHRDETGICPYCAGDLHPGGIYCPHCGAQVEGNPLKCLKCGKPVREGSVYCPHCGSFFKSVKKAGLIDSPLYLLILGLVSIAVAIITYNMQMWIFPFFHVIGGLALGVWLGQKFITPWAAAVAASRIEKQERESEEQAKEEQTGRKTG